MFTTRPEIQGTFGVITSTHWIASAVGMAILEKGGNAFDACAAAGFVLQIVEPHLCGPAGEAPAVFYSARTGKVEVLCSQGVTPAGATIEAYKARGLDLIPGSGLLATVIPGAFDGWMLLLREHGSLPLRDILGPAIGYARDGHPILPRVSATASPPRPSSSPRNGRPPPRPGRRAARSPSRARCSATPCWPPPTSASWTKPRRRAATASAQIEAARHAFMKGFVAEAIDRFCRTTEVMDASGQKNGAVLTGQDLAGWQAELRGAADLRLSRLDGVQAAPLGPGPRAAAVAVDPERLRHRQRSTRPGPTTSTSSPRR